MRRPFFTLGLTLAAVVVLATAAWAAPLSLDASFGGDDGWTSVAVGQTSFATSMVRGGGGIVMAGRSDGDIAVVKLTLAGEVDPSFGGGDGVVTLDLGRNETANAVAVDGQDRIVLAGTSRPGTTTSRLFAARLDAAGTPDPGFAGDGAVKLPSGVNASGGLDLALTESGRIVVVGFLAPPSTDDKVLVVRYRADGTLDPMFGGGDGTVTTRYAGSSVGNAVVIDAKGRLVVAGAAEGGGDGDVGVARFRAGGTSDPSFGAGGAATLDFDPTGEDLANALAIQAGGKIVVAGTLVPAGGTGIGIVGRLHADGTRDDGFGANGRRRLGIDKPAQSVDDALIEHDDDIVVVGKAAHDSLIATVSPDGLAVVWRTVDFAGGDDAGNAVLRLGTGRLLVAGEISTFPPTARAITLTPQFGLARYLPA
jgi:uncharacterized delta-60 repeat protein